MKAGLVFTYLYPFAFQKNLFLFDLKRYIKTMIKEKDGKKFRSGIENK